MNKYFKALLLPLVLTTGRSLAQSNVKFLPEKPVGGDTVQIYYNPEHTALKGLAPVNGVVWVYAGNQWMADDVRMKMTDSGWIGKYRLPERAAFMVVDFTANGQTDKGGKLTYSTMLFDSAGRQMPASYYAWATLRAADTHPVARVAVEDSARISSEVGVFWMNTELKYFPQSRRNIFYGAMELVKAYRGDSAAPIIRREIAALSGAKDITETDMRNISKAYLNLLGDKRAADSVNRLIIGKYPDGITARDEAIKEMFHDSKRRLERWDAFVKKFPLEKFEDLQTDITDLYYSKVYRGVVYERMRLNPSLKALDDMMAHAPLVCLTEFHRLLIMGALSHNQLKPEEAFPYSTQLVNYIENYAYHKRGEYSQAYSPLQWKQYVLSLAVPAYMGHASLLQQKGQVKEALQWMEKVKDQPLAQRPDFLSQYAVLLDAAGRTNEALQIAENATHNNGASPEIIALLKKDYVAKHKNDKGFDAWFQGLKSTEVLNKEREAILAHMIRKTAPPFKLEQLGGGTVDLAKLKGKIVVLDFWATWCAPCKAAMPGMQMAVDHYKNDDSVAFYFIATQETKPGFREEIKKFLQEKHFNMNVLIDARSKGSEQLDDTYKNYVGGMGFSGIPAKFIIDRHGMIRWLGSGYNGSPSALADEIAFIIELLKKEG